MKILFALTGWALWNFAIFSLDKNGNDEKHTAFPLKQYALEKWDNWVGSFITCLILMLIMKLGYGIDVIKLTNISNVAWSDALIGASGPGFEIVMWLVGKVRRFTSQ